MSAGRTTIEVRGPLEAGDTVRFEVEATPDGYAAVTGFTLSGRNVEAIAGDRFRNLVITYPEGSGL